MILCVYYKHNYIAPKSTRSIFKFNLLLLLIVPEINDFSVSEFNGNNQHYGET